MSKVKIGDEVTINTAWANAEFPNCTGKVIALRHGGAVAVIQTEKGRLTRTLHVNYLR